MPWYKTGTVKTTINSNAIIGTGTAFISNSRVGDAFRGPDGNWYEVVNIASDTAMSISPNYQGSTVAAGTYSIAPMQGYVKESADRLRQTVESIGATLALFGGATNVTQLRANIGAAQNGTNSDITNITGLTTALSISQGGTGAKTAPLARTALGLGTAATLDAVGLVAAGAIIERGTTANGEYVKLADGSVECWFNVSLTPTANTELVSAWTLPTGVIISPNSQATVSVAGPGSTQSFSVIKLTALLSNATTVQWRVRFDIGQVYTFALNFKGRWK